MTARQSLLGLLLSVVLVAVGLALSPCPWLAPLAAGVVGVYVFVFVLPVRPETR